MKISLAISINKKCHGHQWFLASKCEWGLPKLWYSRCCHPLRSLQRSWGNARSKAKEETGLAPDSWGAYEWNECSEPRGLHLPIQRMLNSLSWHLIFAVQTACPLCCKHIYSLTPLPASLEQFSQSSWDAVSGSLNILSKKKKQKQKPKNLSTFMLHAFFQSTKVISNSALPGQSITCRKHFSY